MIQQPIRVKLPCPLAQTVLQIMFIIQEVGLIHGKDAHLDPIASKRMDPLNILAKHGLALAVQHHLIILVLILIMIMHYLRQFLII